MARPKNKAETRTLELSVSVNLYDYLSYLAANSLLGVSEADIANKLLALRLNEMFVSNYHEKKVPRSD